MSPTPYLSQSPQRFSLLNPLDLDEDEFDSLFSQPSEGPSQPVEEDSPVAEVALVKKTSKTTSHGTLDSTHIALELNDKATDSEDVEVQEERELEMEDLRHREQAELEKLNLAQAEIFKEQRLV
ncbi:hypothetical protein Tco_1257126 [Tanacetum coccineum]